MSGATLNNWDESAERNGVSRCPGYADTRLDTFSTRCPLCWPEFLMSYLTTFLELEFPCRRAPYLRSVQISAPWASCEPWHRHRLRSILAGTTYQTHPHRRKHA